jgi:hypothetical protein
MPLHTQFLEINSIDSQPITHLSTLNIY